MGCEQEKQGEQAKKKFSNIIDCIKRHKKGQKPKSTETGFQFGAPTDQKTNEILEEIDRLLIEEEAKEGECSDDTIVKKI
jgi:hypothetical protein